ncbi:MAG: histone deacetylase complex regulatory component SIN3 [Chitinophagales bacterium]|jgi:histone deacetylase complex regulatory component SIN3
MISSNKSKLNVQDASINLQLFKENFKGKETILSNFLEDIELNLEKRKIDSINYTRQLNL